MKKHSRSGAIFVAVAALCVAAWWILLEIVPHEAREERAASPPATAAAVAVAAREAHDAWNTYHGNAALTGAASSHLADRLRPAWRFMAGADVRNTPVACDDRVFFTNEDGVVFAVDLDGHQVWAQRIQAGVAEDGTPRQSVIDAPLACFGGALGIGLGFLAASILRQTMSWPVLIQPDTIVSSFLVAAGIGIFFGFWPARKASRLDPIEALRYE